MDVVVGAHVDEHLGVFGEVVGRGENAGVSGDASHVTGRWIMHDTAKGHAILPLRIQWAQCGA